MGVKALRHFSKLSQSTALDDSEFRVLYALAMLHPDDHPEVWASVTSICQKMGRGVQRRSVFRVLTRLERLGIITRQVQPGRVTHYQFTGLTEVPTSDRQSLVTSDHRSPVEVLTSDNGSLALVTVGHQSTSDRGSPRIHEEKKHEETSSAEVEETIEYSETTSCEIAPDLVGDIFRHWQTVMGHPDAKLTPKRRAKIQGRLREGYTPEQIKLAIDGCKVSDFHQGANDSGRIYDDLELIARSGEKIEQFTNYANRKAQINNGEIRPLSKQSKNAAALESAARWLTTPDPPENTRVNDSAITPVQRAACIQ